MARRYRPRKLFKFWLYHDLAADTRLMEYIDYLRTTRQFAKVLRNGLRLMWTLGEGNLSVLFELFPTLRSQLAPDNTMLLEEFRQLLQAQAVAIPQSTQNESASSGGHRALPAPTVALPTFEDEDTVVVRRNTSASMDTTMNFLKAAFAMVGGEAATPAPTGEPAVTKQSAKVILSDDDPPPAPLAVGEFVLKPLR